MTVAGAQDTWPDRRTLAGRLLAEWERLLPAYAAQAAAAPSRRQLDWDLCSQGAVSEADLVAAYSRASGLPAVPEEELQGVEKLEGVPMEFLLQYSCLPVARGEGGLDVLVGDPYNLDAIAGMFSRLHGCRVRFGLVRRSALDRAVASVYETGGEAAGGAKAQDESEESLRNLASEARVVRLVNDLFSRAVEMGASDIHVEPEQARLVVRFRADGLLQEAMTAPLQQFPAVASRIKLIAGMNIAENRLPQDGRINLKLGRNELDIRVSTIPTLNGESIVLRLLRKDAMQYDLARTGLDDALRRQFEELINLPHGMILVVGPTGSGKTTTLYCVMARINTPDVKIITIEDPVEYRMERLSQMQVNPKIGLDFANGLRNIVRQDPDIILVGEIRDRETAEIAIHAALTGHLVFSTLHTNDAAGAISRLQDMGIEGFLIASALAGVLSQRLVRTTCPACGGSGLAAGGRCRTCGGSGYKGRTGIFELLRMNDELRQAVIRRAPSTELAEIARRNGMTPLIEDGRAKVAAGITTEQELARAVQE